MSDGAPETGYERRDVGLRPVVMFTAGVLAAIVLAFVAMAVLVRVYDLRPSAAAHVRTVPPEPRLQTDPLADLAALHARETAQLESYGWTDRQAGRVHIPIARAIDLLASGGRTAR